ncbi:hypothetical protein Pcinc_026873 [Petrolisthes cinctipes]|uniref:Uncharacterized protein n=1 Tax=Petrolisthes cinctipes TaxID=88211 RepID=A0AAE1K9E8_PETCI|nr:hypothetical protein Pcinc_026873 [Petrolisthes cinctipes]
MKLNHSPSNTKGLEYSRKYKLSDKSGNANWDDVAQWREGWGEAYWIIQKHKPLPSLHFLCQRHWTRHSLIHLVARPPIPTTGVKMKEQRHFMCFSPLFIGYKGVMMAMGIALFLCLIVFNDNYSETLYNICVREVETTAMKCACVNAYDSVAIESAACMWTVMEFTSSVMLILGVKKEKASLVFPACLKMSLDINLLVLLVLSVWRLNIRLPVNLVMTFAAFAFIIITYTAYSLCVLASFYWRLMKRPTPRIQKRPLQKNTKDTPTPTPTTINIPPTTTIINIPPINNNNKKKEEEEDDGDRYSIEPVDKMKLIVV